METFEILIVGNTIGLGAMLVSGYYVVRAMLDAKHDLHSYKLWQESQSYNEQTLKDEINQLKNDVQWFRTKAVKVEVKLNGYRELEGAFNRMVEFHAADYLSAEQKAHLIQLEKEAVINDDQR